MCDRCVNNSRIVGLALFALGVIIFFGQRYILGFFALLASLLTPDGAGYQTVLQSSFATYWVAVIMIISGVVVFYTGRKETGNLAPASIHP